MSYVLRPGGVQNPLTEDLDAGDFDITDIGEITVTTVDPADATNGVTIAGATTDKIAFHGADVVAQQTAMPAIILPPLPPTYDATGVQTSLDVLKQSIENVNGVLSTLGLRAA